MATAKKPETLVTVRATAPIRHDGEDIAPGDKLELPASEAKRLVESGFADTVREAK